MSTDRPGQAGQRQVYPAAAACLRTQARRNQLNHETKQKQDDPDMWYAGNEGAPNPGVRSTISNRNQNFRATANVVRRHRQFARPFCSLHRTQRRQPIMSEALLPFPTAFRCGLSQADPAYSIRFLKYLKLLTIIGFVLQNCISNINL